MRQHFLIIKSTYSIAEYIYIICKVQPLNKSQKRGVCDKRMQLCDLISGQINERYIET